MWVLAALPSPSTASRNGHVRVELYELVLAAGAALAVFGASELCLTSEIVPLQLWTRATNGHALAAERMREQVELAHAEAQRHAKQADESARIEALARHRESELEEQVQARSEAIPS